MCLIVPRHFYLPVKVYLIANRTVDGDDIKESIKDDVDDTTAVENEEKVKEEVPKKKRPEAV
jgi:hypothetical protein